MLKKEFQQLFLCYPALPSIVHAGSILQPGQRPPAPSSVTALNPDKAGPLTWSLLKSCFSPRFSMQAHRNAASIFTSCPIFIIGK